MRNRFKSILDTDITQMKTNIQIMRDMDRRWDTQSGNLRPMSCRNKVEY